MGAIFMIIFVGSMEYRGKEPIQNLRQNFVQYFEA